MEPKVSLVTLGVREALAEDANVDPEGVGFSGCTLAHNVFEREQVDAVLAEMVPAGAMVVRPAEDVIFGRRGYFAEPDGYLRERCPGIQPSLWMRTGHNEAT